MSKLNLREPASQQYVYIDPITADIQLLMPIVAGGAAGIGIDNTCKTALELQKFFGFASGQESAKAGLTRYKAALKYDIQILKASGDTSSSVYQHKCMRFDSVNNYIKILTELEKDKEIRGCLIGSLGSFPSFPQTLQKLMQKLDNNIFTILLSPEKCDSYTRTTDQVFSLSRQKNLTGTTSGPFGNELRAAFNGMSMQAQSVKQSIIEKQTSRANPSTDQELIALINDLNKDIRALAGNNYIDLSTTSRGELINMEYLRSIYLEDPETIADTIEGVLSSAVTDDFWDELSASPFASAISISSDMAVNKNAKNERLSILTQFFLGQINIHCHANGISNTDFGKILEGDASLRRELIAAVKVAIEAGNSVERELFNFINTKREVFGVARDLTDLDFATINNRFITQSNTIKDSPHFDEFIIFIPDKLGNAVCHHNLISVNFADFCLAARYREILTATGTAEFSQKKHDEFASMPSERMLSHINTVVDKESAEVSGILEVGYLQQQVKSIVEVASIFNKGLQEQINKLRESKPKKDTKSAKQLAVLEEAQASMSNLMPDLGKLMNVNSEKVSTLTDAAMRFSDDLKTIVQGTKSALDTVGYPGGVKNFVNKLLDTISLIFKFSHRISKKDLEQTLHLTENKHQLTTSFDALNKSSLAKSHLEPEPKISPIKPDLSW